MSSSYFPYQPPPHVLQLSIQQISITKSSNSPSQPNSRLEHTPSDRLSPSKSEPEPNPSGLLFLPNSEPESTCTASLSKPATHRIPLYPHGTPQTSKNQREQAIQKDFMSNLSEHQHKYMDQYVGKEVFSYAEFTERQSGSKVKLNGAKFFQAKAVKAAKAYSDMKERLSRTKSDATINRTKKSRVEKKALSSHRQRVGAGDGGADE